MENHVFVTGACGFVGKVLLPQLLAANYRVTCASSTRHPSEDVESLSLDICDRAAVESAIKQLKPTHVIHLAAVSHVPTSFKEPIRTWQTNVMGTLNLLAAVKEHSPEAFVLFVSSSEVYGESFKANVALDESISCQPMNPYAASKLAAEVAVQQFIRLGVNAVIARPFNHIGPGQSEDFVSASFAKQIAAIEQGLQAPVLKVGNLDAFRDFLDVRDVCSAYLKLLQLSNGAMGETVYNIASGQPVSISNILQTLLGQSSTSIQVEQDAERLRPSDIPMAAGNCRRLQSATGWLPEYSLEDTLAALLADWRKRLAVQ